MFVIMLLIKYGKNELRVIRRNAVRANLARPELESQFYCDHHNGVPQLLALPPGATSFAELERFESSDAAWRSIRDDYCPSLHP